MQMQPPIRYEPALFSLSIAIAIAASTWALQSAFTLRMDTILSAFRKKAGSAIVMGSAIYGMHYTGMSAAIVAADSVCTVNQQNINITSLAGSLGGFSLLFLMATLLISAFDAYLADFSAKYADSLRKLNLDLERQSTELSDANAGLKQEAQVRMRAEQALQQAHDALEERVAERTAQLVRSIQAMLAQIAERKRAEELLRESEAKLHEVIEDRERLARDLHDNIVQAIYAIGMRLEECQRLVRDSPDEVTAQLAQVIDGLNSVIREVRRYIAGSQRQVPRERQLRAHLDQLVAAIQSAEAPRFQLDVDNNAIEHLSRDDAEQILSIARETLSNCLQHSHARHGTLALRLAGGGVRLEISDDGVGFEPQQPAQAGGGLRNMRNRARQIGAQFELLSSPGQGTRIIVQIPKRKKADDLG
jgi:signal transduction histidine kinase